MNYYYHHIGDYTTDTAHLSLLEDGAYRRLMDRYYTTEAPLTRDEAALFRLIRARTEEEQAAVRIVLSEFFQATDAGWVHKRCDTEISAHIAQAARLDALHRMNGYHEHRDFIMRRDGYRCVYCGARHEYLEVDHVIPRIQGGTDNIANLVTACRPCNRSKSGRTPEQWKAL